MHEEKTRCIKPEFKFAYDYDEALKELQVDNHHDLVAQFWPDKKGAAQCIQLTFP